MPVSEPHLDLHQNLLTTASPAGCVCHGRLEGLYGRPAESETLQVQWLGPCLEGVGSRFEPGKPVLSVHRVGRHPALECGDDGLGRENAALTK